MKIVKIFTLLILVTGGHSWAAEGSDSGQVTATQAGSSCCDADRFNSEACVGKQTDVDTEKADTAGPAAVDESAP